MVVEDASSRYRRAFGPSRLAWLESWQPHSSGGLSECSQWLCHNDSIINTLMVITIIIIVVVVVVVVDNGGYFFLCLFICSSVCLPLDYAESYNIFR